MIRNAAAALWTASQKSRVPGLVGFQSAAARCIRGTISRRISSCFAGMSVEETVPNPVMLPPGRARLVTNPDSTGSPTPAMTIGIVRVALIWPLTTRLKSRMMPASSLGSEPCVFTRRRNSPCSRSITFVVRSVFHCALGNRKNVRSSSPPSRRLLTTPGQRCSKRARTPWRRARGIGGRGVDDAMEAVADLGERMFRCFPLEDAQLVDAAALHWRRRPHEPDGAAQPLPSMMQSNKARRPRATRSSRHPFHAAVDSPLHTSSAKSCLCPSGKPPTTPSTAR